MNLQLSLITKWFDMTSEGIKTEDYREITAYWCNRLLLFNGQNKPKQWWEDEFLSVDGRRCDDAEIKENISLFCQFKPFNKNTITKGYPKSTDTDKIKKYKHGGISIGNGNPDWGAEKGKNYFIIKHI